MFKIFVGNLSSKTTAEAVRDLFSRYAPVDDVALAVDPETGKPRGFAIVMIKDDLQGRSALLSVRGARLDGRALIVNQARKRKGKAKAAEGEPGSRPQRPIGRGGYRGGGGGGGGFGRRSRPGGGFGNRPARPPRDPNRPDDRPERPDRGDQRGPRPDSPRRPF